MSDAQHNTEEKVVFIGGFRNTGTRVIALILEVFGYHIFRDKSNEAYDYLGKTFHTHFFKRWYFHKDNLNTIHRHLAKDSKRYKRWAAKHGHFMLMIPELKLLYPQSKFILCVRNPADSMWKKDKNFSVYGRIRPRTTSTLAKKVKMYTQWYDKALPDADLVIRLEDIVNNPREWVCKIVDLLKLKRDPVLVERCCGLIRKPESIGTWKEKGIRPTPQLLEYMKKLGYPTT